MNSSNIFTEVVHIVLPSIWLVTLTFVDISGSFLEHDRVDKH